MDALVPLSEQVFLYSIWYKGQLGSDLDTLFFNLVQIWIQNQKYSVQIIRVNLIQTKLSNNKLKI